MFFFLWRWLVALWVLLFGKEDDNNEETLPPMVDRMLGLGVTEGNIGFEAAFAQAQASGIQFLEFSQQWDDIETSPGVYSSEFLSTADAYYPQRNVSLVLSLNAIDTNKLRVPTFYQDHSWDERVNAFNAWADWTLEQLPNTNVLAISVGNEVNAWLTTDDAANEYAAFFAAVRNHIQSYRPSMVMGVKMMLEGRLPTVDAEADAVMLTYYPFQEGLDFQVKPLNQVAGDITSVMNTASKPVYLLEAGIPSGSACAGSESIQADFVDEIFRLWDAYVDRLPLVLFNWLVDIPEAQVDAYMTYYDLEANQGFRCFLGTLGLIKSSGDEKMALQRLRYNVHQRNGSS